MAPLPAKHKQPVRPEQDDALEWWLLVGKKEREKERERKKVRPAE